MTEGYDHQIRREGLAGFSLVETLLAATISVVVLLGLYLVYEVNQATFIRGEQQADLQQNARIGMDRLVRELRLAGSDPSGTLTGGPPISGKKARCAGDPPDPPRAIENAEVRCVRFYADVEPEGPLATERVEYSYDGAGRQLRRRVWTHLGTSAGAQPLAERVGAVTFAYYDGAGACLGGACATPPDPVPAGSLDSIRRISVVLSTQDIGAQSGSRPFTLRAEVLPRNLGANP